VPEDAFEYLKIGYVPTGSSNDFARDLGLGKDRKQMIRTILEDKVVRTLDVGCVKIHEPGQKARGFAGKVRSEKRFLVSGGIGFDAAVCEAANVSKAKKILNRIGLGKLTYGVIALSVILHRPQKGCRIRVDDKPEVSRESFLFAAAMNHRFEGGGFKFAPMAESTDGSLDLCVAGNISKTKFLYGLPKALKGTHFTVKGIDHYAGREIEISSDIPMWIHTDGEVETSGDHVTFTCKRGALKMLN
jgi:diacylglycerol kinase family enzyme